MSKRVYKKPTVKNRRQFEPPGQQEKKKHAWNWDTFDDPEVSKLLSSKRWRDLRMYVFNHHPLCVLCERPAQELHHIDPVRKNMPLFFRVDNLAPLCEECHAKVNSAYRRGIKPEVLFPKNRRLEI
jgi:5-methylcytosine-specific restriction endonuclease McrA